MFLAGKLKTPLSASIAFDRSNALWAKLKPHTREPPKLILRFGEPHTRDPQKLILRFGEPLHKQKERTNRFIIAEMLSLISVREVFAYAKVKLCYAQ